MQKPLLRIREEVYIGELRPGRGTEIDAEASYGKTRPCVVVSLAHTNKVLDRVMIIPMSGKPPAVYHDIAYRNKHLKGGKPQNIKISQMRVVSIDRLADEKLGEIPSAIWEPEMRIYLGQEGEFSEKQLSTRLLIEKSKFTTFSEQYGGQ